MDNIKIPCSYNNYTHDNAGTTAIHVYMVLPIEKQWLDSYACI